MSEESHDLSPENLKTLIEMLQLAVRQEADGKPIIHRMSVSEDRVRIMIREELAPVLEQMKQFVPSDQINMRLERLGLPPDHHEEIAVALRAYIWVYKFASKIGLGILAAGASALAAYFFKSVFKIDLDIGSH